MNRIPELFEDGTGQLSMIRFLIAGAWFVSSYAVIHATTVEMVTVYMATWGVLAANNKWQETRPEIAKAQAAAAPAVINQEKAINNVDAT